MLNLTSAEERELWQAYAETIALEQANFRTTARQAHGIDLPQNIRIPYRLVLSDSSSILQKIKSHQLFSDALAGDKPWRMIKSTTDDAIIKRLNLLDDLPLSLQKHVGEFLLFEDGKGLLGVSRHIRAAVINRCYPLLRPAELTLVMDITGSMREQLNEAKSMLRTILHSLNTTMLQKGFYQRSAWLGYRDLKDREPFHLKDFSTNPDVISQYIQNTMAHGGDDVPEDVAGAMHLLLSDLSWTANPHARGLKNVVWVLDAPPHGMGSADDHYPNGTPGRDWLALAHLMKKRGVVVHPVVCAELPELDLFASTVAHITGGTCVRLSSDAIEGALSQQIIACINRDVNLQQALEIEINKRLQHALNQAESIEMTPQLIAGFAAQAVQALLTSDAYQITELPEMQLPLTDTAERLSRCDSQPSAQDQGLLPGGRSMSGLSRQMTVPVILPSIDDFFAPYDAAEAALPFDHSADATALLVDDDELDYIVPIRLMTQGGSAHYVRPDLSSSVKKRTFSTLKTINEHGDDGMEESVDVVDGHRKRSSVAVADLSTVARTISIRGFFAHQAPRPRALTTEPLRTTSSSHVHMEELTQHAQRAAWRIERSFTCAEVCSNVSKMSLGGSSDNEG